MDLFTAKDDAKKLSTERKKMVFIDVDGEGEAELSDIRGPQTLHAFQDGNEVPVPPLEAPEDGKKNKKKSTSKTKKQMAEKKVKPVKKSTKKAAKKVMVDTRTTQGSTRIPRATTITLTKAQWTKLENKLNGSSLREGVTAAVTKFFSL